MNPTKTHDILRDRPNLRVMASGGLFHLVSTLDKIMIFFGLIPNEKCLRECSYERAIEIVKIILWKDLAHGINMIDEHLALERAKVLVDSFYTDGVVIYTNDAWPRIPLTDATFDAGVLFIGTDHAACIWVEDED